MISRWLQGDVKKKTQHPLPIIYQHIETEARFVRLQTHQEWPRQTKPKKGQFMKFSPVHELFARAFRNKSSMCANRTTVGHWDAKFSPCQPCQKASSLWRDVNWEHQRSQSQITAIFCRKLPEFTKKGEIHELFVLALSLVWFAGVTPEHCVSCVIADYRCYAPTSFRKKRSIAVQREEGIAEKACLWSEIHELFVLALFLVWFAGATPDFWRGGGRFRRSGLSCTGPGLLPPKIEMTNWARPRTMRGSKFVLALFLVWFAGATPEDTSRASSFWVTGKV